MKISSKKDFLPYIEYHPVKICLLIIIRNMHSETSVESKVYKTIVQGV